MRMFGMCALYGTAVRLRCSAKRVALYDVSGVIKHE